MKYNLFGNTANVYSDGQSEEILGKTLNNKRHQVIIATKVRGRMGSGPNEPGLSRLHIIQQVEESLKDSERIIRSVPSP